MRAAFQPGGDLHFVNVSGTAGGFAERLAERRPRRRSTRPSSRSPRPRSPRRPRRSRSWSAAPPGAPTSRTGGCAPREPGRATARSTPAVIHHTVNANDYTKAEAAGIVLGICRFHVNGNGWNDIGYNALVDRFGRRLRGPRRAAWARPVVGAQAQGFNAADDLDRLDRRPHTTVKLSTQGAAAGDHPLPRLEARPPRRRPRRPGRPDDLGAGAARAATRRGPWSPCPRVIGHRDLGLTECPGDGSTRRCASIRKLVQKRAKPLQRSCRARRRERQLSPRAARPVGGEEALGASSRRAQPLVLAGVADDLVRAERRRRVREALLEPVEGVARRRRRRRGAARARARPPARSSPRTGSSSASPPSAASRVPPR